MNMMEKKQEEDSKLKYILVIISLLTYPDEPLGHIESIHDSLADCHAAEVLWLLEHKDTYAQFVCVYQL